MESDSVRNHGVILNPANWERYSSASEVAEICSEISNLGQGAITRQYVRYIFSKSIRKGIVASIIWGYPAGRFPGGRSFADIFSRVDELAARLEELRIRNPDSAKDICSKLQGFAGLGPSTYTKMLYFAGVVASEGRCLIYDQMVMRAIAECSEENWASLRARLGSCRTNTGRFRVYPRVTQELTYGEYLAAAHSFAIEKKRSADSIELELFINAPRGRPTQHKYTNQGRL